MRYEYSISRTEPKSWQGCEPPTDDERLAEWMYRYFKAGHHHRAKLDDDQETMTIGTRSASLKNLTTQTKHKGMT